MANVRNGNTYYVDSTGNLDIKNIKVVCIYLTATAASGRIVLSDSTTGALKADVRVPTANDTKVFDCEHANMVFPNGITITTLTNAVVTLFLEESQR